MSFPEIPQWPMNIPASLVKVLEGKLRFAAYYQASTNKNALYSNSVTGSRIWARGNANGGKRRGMEEQEASW
jgi:hypothetical protein